MVVGGHRLKRQCINFHPFLAPLGQQNQFTLPGLTSPLGQKWATEKLDKDAEGGRGGIDGRREKQQGDFAHAFGRRLNPWEANTNN